MLTITDHHLLISGSFLFKSVLPKMKTIINMKHLTDKKQYNLKSDDLRISPP